MVGSTTANGSPVPGRRSAYQWPAGVRVAVSLVLNYEEGGQRTMREDGVNEGLGEWPRTVGDGYPDLATESVYEYGSRAGMYRLLRLFDAYSVHCTVFASAIALLRSPETADWVRQAGHEVCGHGLRWSEDWTVSKDEEAGRIREAVRVIESVVGARPVGWYSRWMPSANTRALLVREGGFVYDSNAYNDDHPYYVDVQGHWHLVIPYTLTYNDARYSIGHFGAPSDFADYLRRALDYLWWEGESHPSMMSVGLHARISGQAGRASAVREFIEYAQSLSGVWIVTRRDLAEWWLANNPPPPRIG